MINEYYYTNDNDDGNEYVYRSAAVFNVSHWCYLLKSWGKSGLVVKYLLLRTFCQREKLSFEEELVYFMLIREVI